MKRVLLACIWLTVGCGSDEDGVLRSSPRGTAGSPSTSANANSLTEPKDTSAAGDKAKLGDACTSADECPAGGSGTPACLSDWPSGGYCVVESCTDHGHDCPGDPGNTTESTTGAKCVLDPEPRCLALCAAAADCRSGYVCTSRTDAAGHASINVCVPDANVSMDGAPASAQEGAAAGGMAAGSNDGMMMPKGTSMGSGSAGMAPEGAAGSGSMSATSGSMGQKSNMEGMAGAAPGVGMVGAGGMAGVGSIIG